MTSGYRITARTGTSIATASGKGHGLVALAELFLQLRNSVFKDGHTLSNVPQVGRPHLPRGRVSHRGADPERVQGVLKTASGYLGPTRVRIPPPSA
jgi:hypothetical protein